METETNGLLALTVATFFVSVIAALYAVLTYKLKAGIRIRGSFGITQSIAAEDRYVQNIVLENLKDRAVVIFTIFLELDHGYFLEIENFEDKPLILGPFEAYQKHFDPIDHYLINMRRVRLDRLFVNKARRRLVLSTSEGRYNVSSWIHRWYLESNLFSNYTTALISPMRSTFEGKAYGSGTRFVIRLRNHGKADEVIPIYPRDWELKRFKNLQLTREALETRESLEAFLLEEAIAGRLRCSDLEVFDLQQWRDEIYKEHGNDPIELSSRGWFIHNVLGFVTTKWEDVRLWRLNREHRKRHNERKRHIDSTKRLN